MNKYQAQTQFIGRNIKYLESCESTNSLALQECLENDPDEGFCFITDHQSNGRGQRGNRWDSKAGDNLLFSLILKPNLSANQQFYLSKAVAIAICEGIKSWAIQNHQLHLPIHIKWPNDIYVDNQKIGGVLIENQWNAGKWTHAVIGIGLNINQEHFGDLRATSLKSYARLAKTIDKSELFHCLCESIEQSYQSCLNQHFQEIDQHYHANLLRLNEWYLYQDAESQEVFDGKIMQVNEQGLLLIEKQNEVKLYDLKEIIFIFPF